MVVSGWEGQKRNGSGFYSQKKAVGYRLIGDVRTFRTSEKIFPMSGCSDARDDGALFLKVS